MSISPGCHKLKAPVSVVDMRDAASANRTAAVHQLDRETLLRPGTHLYSRERN